MHYEVNVSHNGSHYFATDARSLRNERDAKTVFDALVARFTEAQGFKVTLTKWISTGTQIS